MKKQQESQATLISHQSQAVEHIRELVSTLDDTTKKTSSMEDNLKTTLNNIEEKVQEYQKSNTEEMDATQQSHITVLDKLHADVIELGTKTQERMQASEHALHEWAKQWRAELDNTNPGAGVSQKRDFAIDPAKDIPIVVLKDGASKADFIQWRETLDLRLECIQGYEDAEDILTMIRRRDSEITLDEFNVIKQDLIKNKSKCNTWAWDYETI